jgi:hypothetical protein
MSVNDTNRTGSIPTTVEESPEPTASQEPSEARGSTILNGKPEPATTFATRADVKGVEGISKSKLVLLGGGLPLWPYGADRYLSSQQASSDQGHIMTSVSASGLPGEVGVLLVEVPPSSPTSTFFLLL